MKVKPYEYISSTIREMGSSEIAPGSMRVPAREFVVLLAALMTSLARKVYEGKNEGNMKIVRYEPHGPELPSHYTFRNRESATLARRSWTTIVLAGYS